MPVHAFSFDVKELTQAGQFRGVASAYSNTDLAGEAVMPGAFARTLMEAGKQRPLLWQHASPIGLVTLTDSPAGLICDGKLSLGIQLAQDALTLMRDGVIKGLSIGYSVVKEQFVGDVRQLLELKLFEISLVTFPANELATIAAVKAAQHHREKIQLALKSLRNDVLSAFK